MEVFTSSLRFDKLHQRSIPQPLSLMQLSWRSATSDTNLVMGMQAILQTHIAGVLHVCSYC